MITTEGSQSLHPDSSNEPAAESMMGANPFIGLTRGQVAAALARWAGRAAQRPSAVAKAAAKLTRSQIGRARRLANVGA